MPELPEQFLRHVWQHQSFSADGLHTTDGRKISIISPGVPNTDGGPDFIGARIRIGNVTFAGDVELHTDAVSWHSHHHEADPHYNRVILHVVIADERLAPPARTASRRFLPLLVLHPYLDPKLREIWMESPADENRSETMDLKCALINDRVSANVIVRWVEHLAEARIEMKVRRFEERLKQLIDESRLVLREPYPRYYGNPDDIPKPQRTYTQRDFASKALWEQLLYEGIMEALGYSKNQSPFLTLAQSVRLELLKQQVGPGSVMALLFGAAGLLPSSRSVSDKESRAYVRGLRKTWKQLRPVVKGPLLNAGDWQFFRLRPNNFPTLRLAAASFLLPNFFGDESLRKLVGLFKGGSLTSKQRIVRLRGFCACTPDEFWQSHYRFGQRSAKPVVALGSARIDEIIANVILPVLLLYARLFKDPLVRTQVRAVLSSLGSSQENSVTRLLEQQLFKEKVHITSVFRQQGGIQLYKMYCTQGRCDECEVGRRVFFSPKLEPRSS
ncbi:MAG: DUF2851 family protein [Bacteroidota bacterium]